MLATITHDLRTPINSIQFMIKEANQGVNSNYLNMALINCNLLLFLVNDILDYSLIKEKKLKTVKEQFNLSQFLVEIE